MITRYWWIAVIKLVFAGAVLGQSAYCGGNVSASSSTAFVYLFQGTPIELDGQPLELGSHIIAVFQNSSGQWECAGETQWWGYNTLLNVRGADSELEGYEEGETLRFYVQLPNGCVIDNVVAEFEVSPQFPDGDSYTQAGKSRVASLSATFDPMVNATILADTCEVGTGQILIEDIEGAVASSITWPDGQNGNVASGLSAGAVSPQITTTTGCIFSPTFEIPSADCPLLLAEATCNGSSEGDAGCAPFTAVFLDATQSEAGVQEWLWDFGDGNMSTEPDPTHVYPEPGNYTVLLTVSDAYQTASYELSVTVYPAPTAEWSYQSAVCQPEQVTLAATSQDMISDWEWTFPDIGTATGPTTDINFGTNGTIVEGTLLIVDANGCTNLLPLTIDLPPAYDLLTTVQSSIPPTCALANGSITITASGGVPPYEYAWPHEANNTTTIATTLPAGQFVAITTDSNGCVDSLTVSLSDTSTLPAPDLGPDTAFCVADPILLHAGTTGSSYQWFLDGDPLEGINTATLLPEAAGVYILEVTSTDDCTGADTVFVDLREHPEAAIFTSDEQVCSGGLLQLSAMGGDQYIWLDTSQVITTPEQADVSLFPIYTSTYGLVASNLCGADTTYNSIQVIDRYLLTPVDTCVASGKTVALNAPTAEAYAWRRSGSEILLSNDSDLNISPDTTTLYILQMTDSLGCVYEDTIQVRVLQLSELEITPIGLITPNGDGHNDVLAFADLTKFAPRSLTVFNRWGGVVYDSFNYGNDWDGTRNGTPLPDGVYYYVLRVGQQELKHSLTIIRQ